jgi:hypothetical protein
MNNTTPHLIKLAKHFSAYADILDCGVACEQEAAQVLRLLAVAMRQGRTAELEAYLVPLVDKWLDESIGEGVAAMGMVLEQSKCPAAEA